MPSTMILETPKVIQRAWNDGLYNLRVKRNGNPRGHSIEEKVLYVLGLGYKYNGSMEVRDEEIRGSLNISLDGLTQDAKFIKIGQVLWEQCSPDFIAKMISSLSNINREQSIMYQSLARDEARNYKGYFNRSNTRAIKRHGLDPAAVLGQERKQMTSNQNLTERNRERLQAQRNRIFQSQLSSKGIEKRLVRFKATTKETKKLLNELGILLKTHDEYKDSIAEIANDLGIQVESGFNKNYLIEEIKAVVVGYVESEVLNASAQRGPSSNVYIRVDTPKGIERIRSLLKYTSYSVLSAGDFITVDDLKQRNAEVLRMRENAKAFLDKKGDINYKKLNKHVARRQKLEQTLYKIEGDVSAKGKKVSEADVISFYKFLTSTEMRSDDKQDTNILLPGTNDGVGFKFYNPLRDAGNDSLRPVEVEAFKAWHSQKKTDVEMARGFRGRYTEEEMSYVNGPAEQRPFELNMPYLIAEGYSQDELLASMVHISNGMGLKSELNNITSTTDIPYGTVSFFMLGVLRRFVALEKLRKKRV